MSTRTTPNPRPLPVRTAALAATLLLGWQDRASPALLERMDGTVARLLTGHGRSYYASPPTDLLAPCGRGYRGSHRTTRSPA